MTTNDSNATPTQCRLDSTLGCDTNSVGYSCQGDLKPAAVCGAGSAELDGETGYCCSVGATCGAVDGVGCTNGSTGYSCTGSVAPGSEDASLSCGSGVSGQNGDVLYCCYSVASSSCSADSSVTGCSGGSYGFSCTSTDTPSQSNASLDCSDPTSGPGGSSLYCCIGFSGSQSSCAADSTVTGCHGGSYGFSCTGSDTPNQTNDTLNCSSPITGPNNELLYCCSNN